MGELILCKRPIAAIPYYLEGASINVYSLEELSYFLYHHTYQIPQDFMSVELCHWIGKELHIPELEQQLLEMLKENVPLHIFVGHLLSGTDYLTAGEIRETLTKIQNFENKSDAECRKIFADQLMDQKAYIQAISVYDSILNQDNVRNQPQLFMGDIWHNMGTAYARLFLFPQAADCFEMAYQRNRRDDSLNALLLALLMGDDGEGLAEKAKKFRVPEAYIQRAREQMEAAGESRDIRLFAQSVDMYNLETSFYQKEEFHPDEILRGWEDDYRKFYEE